MEEGFLLYCSAGPRRVHLICARLTSMIAFPNDSQEFCIPEAQRYWKVQLVLWVLNRSIQKKSQPTNESINQPNPTNQPTNRGIKSKLGKRPAW